MKISVMIVMVTIIMEIICEGCLEKERSALIELKSYINSVDHLISSSWGTDFECCNWTGVECNNNGQITHLNIGQTYWTLDWSIKDLHLNASLFLNFQHLNSLSLAGYSIVGCLQNHGFEKLSALANLEHLDLGYNKLDSSILPSLSYLSYLKYLDLTSNKLQGTLSISELNNLIRLRELDITRNKIEGLGTSDGSERLTLPNLELLHLGYNKLNYTILQLLSDLPRLKFLGLEHNRLKGKINFSELNNLTNLREVDISGNAIEGFEALQGGEGFLKLKKLEALNFSFNLVKSDILTYLGGLASLKALDISYNQLKGPFNLKELDGLSNLEELDLSGNEITKFLSTKDYKGPSKLTILYLDNMTMTNERSNLVPKVGVVWPNLKSLYLRFNNLQGQTFGEGESHVEEVFLDHGQIDEIFLESLSKAFPSLKVLSLIELGGALPYQGLPTFENLEHLYLNGTDLSNHFLPKVGTTKRLKTLSLPKCGLSGKIPTSQGLCQLKNLEELDMQDNSLSGNLPCCLANLTSLTMLQISSNQLSGDISLSPLRSLTSLHYLDISYNLFKIPTSFAPFFNHSILKYLSVDYNTLYTTATDHYTWPLTPKFQLECLLMNGLPDTSLSIPEFLYHQHDLQVLALSNNNLRGNFPNWLLKNNTRLHFLFLGNNSLSGPLHLPISPHKNLFFLDISDNLFNGSIPYELGVYLPGLMWLDMSINNFNGAIPDSLCKPSLYFMDISRNHISGTIPICIGKMSQLGVLDLSRNNLFGYLPSKFSPLSLLMVDLSYNRLQGTLKDAFYNCSRLFILNLGNNEFSGSIPSWIGRFSQLSYLMLRSNTFQGKIPIELCKLKKLSFLDFSHNNITGKVLPCLSFISYWDWQEDEFPFEKELEFATKGSSYNYQPAVLSYLSGLDLSSNNLTGEIPYGIGNIGDVQVLNLSHNSLTGNIPPTFSNLREIESLDLSHNNLEGKIPSELTQLTKISDFNVSCNNLSGQTPNKVAQFATFDESSYRGNPLLCGWPLLKDCRTEIKLPPSTISFDNEEDRNGFVDMEVFYASFGVAYGMALLVLVAVLCINPYWRTIWFYNIQMCIDKISKPFL